MQKEHVQCYFSNVISLLQMLNIELFQKLFTETANINEINDTHDVFYRISATNVHVRLRAEGWSDKYPDIDMYTRSLSS